MTFFFEYNNSPNQKSIHLEGNYFDLNGARSSKKIILEPFSSIVLIKTSDSLNNSEPVSNIKIINPENNSQLTEGDEVSIKVEMDNIEDIEKINFYFCETLISTGSVAPFSCTWEDMPGGRHYLHVEAFDKYGNVFTSDSIFVEVKNQNVPPTIYIASPTENKKIFAGQSFNMKGSAMDPDGNITLIQFLANDQPIGTANENPYDFTWNNVPEGSYVITVRVVDNEQNESISDPIQLTVDQKTQLPSDEDILIEGYSLYVNLGSKTEVKWKSQPFIGEEALTSHIKGKTSTFSDAYSIAESPFQTERFGREFTISVPVPNGTYTVNTYHNELYFGKGGPEAKSGQRVYDISLQQETVREMFDLFVESDNKPAVLTFKQVKVSNDILELSMNAHANNASISGLAIIQDDEETVKPEGTIPETGPPVTATVIRLKTGYASDLKYNGDTFVSDYKFKDYYQKSFTYNNSNASDQELFQSERNGGVLKYAIPIPNGIYTVKTYHNELYFGHSGASARAGRRVFNIAIENKTVKKGFDLFVENKNRPTVLTFEQVTVTDGILNIDMVAATNRATISAISIYENMGIASEATEEKYTWFLNTGGKSDELFNENVFFSESGTEEVFYNANSRTYSNSDASDEGLFQTERNSGRLSYRLPVPNGAYSVYTMHNELYFGYAGPSAVAGRRVFDISIEGEIVEKRFDIFVKNSNRPIVLEFKDIQVTDGFLDLEMLASQNRATVSGIAIFSNHEPTAMQGVNLRKYIDIDHNRGYPEMEINKRHEGFSAEEILIYPNPAREKITIAFNAEIIEGRILIHDMAGQLINHFDLSRLIPENNRYIVPLDNISQGTYLITVIDKLEVITRQRLIVTY